MAGKQGFNAAKKGSGQVGFQRVPVRAPADPGSAPVPFPYTALPSPAEPATGLPTFDELLTEEMRAQWVHERALVMETLAEVPDTTVDAWYLTQTAAGRTEFNLGVVAGTYTQSQAGQLAQLAETVTKGQEAVLRRAETVSADRVLDFRALVADARESPYVATTLQKNATKQNIPEKVAHAFLADRTGLSVLRLRDSDTRLSVRFDDDGVVGVNVPATSGQSKDADFIIVVPRRNGTTHVVLASHKHAREGGGHQDNQKADAFRFLANASEAAAAGRDIPGLADIVACTIGRSAGRVTWEPALILDGPYFAGAAVYPDARPSMQSRFVGNSEQFAAWVTGGR
jgi:hypothetical protein